MTVVVLTTVLVDLMTSGAVGLVLASIFFVKRMGELELANLHIITNPATGKLINTLYVGMGYF